MTIPLKTLLPSCLLAVCCLLATAPNSAASVLLPSNTWVTEPVTLMHAGDFFPTTYIAPADTQVILSGYWVTGEFYTVYVNSVPVLTTPQVLPAGVHWGDPPTNLYQDPGSAYASNLFSTGSFMVHTGDSIRIQDLNPPEGIGEVGLLAAPEPGSFALLGLGLAGFVSLRRRSVH